MVEFNPFIKGNQTNYQVNKPNEEVTVKPEAKPEVVDVKATPKTEEPKLAKADSEVIRGFYGVDFQKAALDPEFAAGLKELYPQYAAGVERYVAVAPKTRIGSHEAAFNQKAPQAVNGDDDFTPYLAALDPKYNNVENRMRIALEMEDFAALT